MSPSLITRTSFGGSSYQSNRQPPSSSISAQPGSGQPSGSRPVGLSSTGKVDHQATRSSDQTTPSFRTSEKRDQVCRGNGSDSDRSSHDAPRSAIDNEVEEEVDSDDSDDVPLGQRHPDALKVQKSLREDRAKRHARRKLREAEKAERDLANLQRQKNIEDQHRKEAAQRELDLAAAAAKLTMKPNSNDDDDNKPLNLLKRQKSCAKQRPAPRDPFTVSPDELSRRLENVQHHGRSKTEDTRSPRVAGLSINTKVASCLPEPIGHPLLPQTDASVQSRKQSRTQLEPLSPFIKESLLTIGGAHGSAVDDDDLDPSGREQASSPKYVAMFHNIPTRSRQQELPQEGRVQGQTGKSPKANAIDLNPAVSSPSVPARREPLKRGQTLGLPSTLPSTTARKMDVHTNPPVEPTSTTSRSDGLRRGNTLASRKVGPSMSASPPLPNNLLPPAGANLSRTKSQARKPSALAIPPQATPSDATALLSPPLACHSPTLASNPLPRPSRRVLQKVAIIDQTRTVMIEIDEKSTVSDLLKEAEQRGELATHSQGYGEWGVFEVWENLGIERPIREVETVMSVVDTWTANTDNSYLLIQRHALASLAIQKRAMTAGTWSSNLFFELKPGKWSKKYVILKENGIYFCSNEKGKDEVFLCTLANFDIFYVASSRVKAPKPFAFGVKSLNKYSFFETKSDFIHYFACKDENTQLEWIRRVYDARTFYIMSNAAATTSQEVPRTKLSDPPSSMLGRVSAEHGASARPKVSNTTPRLPSGSHIPPTTELAPTEGRTRNVSASGGLSRKPTLLGMENVSKFRQGTLLGDLNQPGASNRPTQQPALPAHVTPAAGTTTRGWEQMGPDERKEHLAEVQARAKSDGKTLLRFQDTDPFAQGPIKRLGAEQPYKPLSRSRTLGSRKP